ncbi:hypothetical protein BG011_001789 [Mortierella polycephala]|uniref:Aminoglycoside phosphotransferase domain-containing protein n=1 Tax=Mortierella polycephala TaxID=41804 RepID=A0A9P6QE45_9FUNG|nr:hypothetical protein BG011_001789 [Mortierella polycephala]
MTASTITYSPYTYHCYSLQSVAAQAYATLRRHAVSIFGPDHAPLPGDSQISIPWLTRTLIDASALPSQATIISAECKGLDGNRGLVGVMTRILVTYTLNKDTHELHLILKKSNDGRKTRLGNIISGQIREAIFYSSDLAKQIAPKTLLPKVYYAHGSEWLGEHVILMEDVKQRHGKDKDAKMPVDVNFIFGNQIWGIPDSIDRQALPPAAEMLEHMFVTAAETHAQHWNDAGLLHLSWLKSAGWYHGTNRARWEWGVHTGASGWANGKIRAESAEYPVKYSDKFVKIMDESFKRASWDRLQKRLQDKSLPFTLVHGDFHAANMILDQPTSSATSSSSIVLYDWSEVGIWEPTADLGQTVISDVPISLFKAHARPALQKYWDRLVELGTIKESDYPFETCWRSFLRGGVEKWLWMFAILSGHFAMPAPAMQYFHDQMMAFIDLAGDVDDEFYEVTMVSCL